jgi:hypothetical protein
LDEEKVLIQEKAPEGRNICIKKVPLSILSARVGFFYLMFIYPGASGLRLKDKIQELKLI